VITIPDGLKFEEKIINVGKKLSTPMHSLFIHAKIIDNVIPERCRQHPIPHPQMS